MSVRGDAVIKVDGEEYKLRLTLGALAEIEEELDVENVTEAFELIATAKAGAIRTIVKAACKGGGKELPEDKLDALDFHQATAALTEMFAATFPNDEEANTATEGKPEKN